MSGLWLPIIIGRYRLCVCARSKSAGRLQYNPARIRSTASKVDAVSLSERPCFLCDANRPVEQLSLPIGGQYKLLVNPYPIFPRHFTLPSVVHTPQAITGRFADMLELASLLPEYVIFYNGARCGASAPDHMHFQAGNRGFVPIESQWESLWKEQGESERWNGGVTYSWLTRWPAAMLVFEGESIGLLQSFFCEVWSVLPVFPGEVEPLVNVLCTFTGGFWRCWLILRSCHRPRQYDRERKDGRLISPGAVDMAGVVITPRESDFSSVTASEMDDVYRQVASPALLDLCLAHLKKGHR